MNVIKATEISSILENVPAAKSIFARMANRERDRNITNFNTAKQLLKAEGVNLSEDDLKQFFSFCAEKHLGRIVHGRNGNSSRFIWAGSQKAIGQAVVAGQDITVGDVPTKQVGRPKGSRNRRRRNITPSSVSKTPVANDPVVTFQIPALQGQLPLSKLNELNAIIKSYLK